MFVYGRMIGKQLMRKTRATSVMGFHCHVVCQLKPVVSLKYTTVTEMRFQMSGAANRAIYF